jgi:hypothetical protein
LTYGQLGGRKKLLTHMFPESMFLKVGKLVAFSPTRNNIFQKLILLIQFFGSNVVDVDQLDPRHMYHRPFFFFPKIRPTHAVIVENNDTVSLTNCTTLEVISAYNPKRSIHIRNCHNLKVVNITNINPGFLRIPELINGCQIVPLLVLRWVSEKPNQYFNSTMYYKRVEVYDSMIMYNWNFGDAEDIVVKRSCILPYTRAYPRRYTLCVKTLECSVSNMKVFCANNKFPYLENLKLSGIADQALSSMLTEIRSLKRLEWITDNPSKIIDGLSCRPIPNISLKIFK